MQLGIGRALVHQTADEDLVFPINPIAAGAALFRLQHPAEAQLEQREIIIHTLAKHKSGPLHVVSLIRKAAAPTDRLQRRRERERNLLGLLRFANEHLHTRTRA